MITKILKAKNIGRLNIPTSDNPNAENRNDALSFANNTLIFADNTFGKTTLTAIFKSLAKSDKNLISSRKRFNSDGNINIVIEYIDDQDERKSYSYSGSSWDNKDIIIFDNDFIRDYVFSEDQIKSEHLKSLPKILIGSNIRADHQQIQSMADCGDADCGNCEACLKNAINIHKSTFNREYDLERFVQIKSKIEDVNDQILSVKNELKLNEELASYKAKINNSTVWNLNLVEFKNVFDKSLNSAFEAAIESHIKNNTKGLDTAKDFLEKGLGLLKDNKCPFCAKSLDDVKDLIKNLKEYFNQEFKDLKKAIKTYGSRLSYLKPEDVVILLNDIGLGDLASEWSKEENKTAIEGIKQKSNSKVLDLSYDFFPSSDNDFLLVETLINKTREQLQKIMDRQELTDQEKSASKQKLISLKINEYRYSEEGEKFYEKWHNLNEKLQQINRKKISAQTTLKTKVNNAFRQNLDNINGFLKSLHADFKIVKMQPTIDNRSIDSLKLGDYVFEFTDVDGNNNPVQKEQFKETFSDSDKRLLGFAFFLSILKNDDDLGSRIIVLDDPFSSFDANRKMQTVNLFASITNVDRVGPKQKIVLTHEKGFYCQLNDALPKSKLLKLNYSVDNKGSMLEEVDIDKFKADEYYEDIEYIKQSINSNNNLNEALPKARKCLEYLLKAKYITILKGYKDSNGRPIGFNQTSVHKFLEAIGDNCPVKTELEQLNLSRFHHNQIPLLSSMSDAEKNHILAEFIELMEKV